VTQIILSAKADSAVQTRLSAPTITATTSEAVEAGSQGP